MKKLFVMLLIAILALSATAFAATYNYDSDITFEYDDTAMEITSETHTDDEDRIAMGFKESAWGDGYVSIQLNELPDGQSYPTQEDFAKSLNVEASALESLPNWGNFTNVITTSYTTDDLTETVFIAPVFDDDGEADNILTVVIGVTALEDDEAAMQRDDAISAIVDTLKVDE